MRPSAFIIASITLFAVALCLLAIDEPLLTAICMSLAFGLSLFAYLQRIPHKERPLTGRVLNPSLPHTQHLAWCKIDENGLLLSWSGNSAHLLGIQNENDVLGIHLPSMVLDKGMVLGLGLDTTVALERKDETVIAVRIIQVHLEDGDKRPGTYFLLEEVTQHIDEIAQLQDRVNEFENVFNTIEDDVLLLNIDGTVNQANSSALKRFGSECVGASFYEIARFPDEPLIDHIIEQCLSTFKPASSEQHLSVQNKTVAINVYPVFNKNKKLRQITYIERDITEARLMELEIRLQTQKLQDNVIRLREADEAKDQWLNSVSHELRTPLTSIRSYSELLLTYPDTDLDTRQEFLNIINSESQRLSRLINEMLDYASIESGKLSLDYEDLELADVINNCLATIKPLATENGITLQHASSQKNVCVVSNADRLGQVLINGLNNSIKFAPSNSAIRIDVDADEHEVRISIEDDGPGIEPKDRRRIFERFTQLDNTLTNKAQGTGLGLAICKQIIEALSGSIRFTDPIQLTGARLLITLPRNPQSELSSSKIYRRNQSPA